MRPLHHTALLCDINQGRTTLYSHQVQSFTPADYLSVIGFTSSSPRTSSICDSLTKTWIGTQSRSSSRKCHERLVIVDALTVAAFSASSDLWPVFGCWPLFLLKATVATPFDGGPSSTLYQYLNATMAGDSPHQINLSASHRIYTDIPNGLLQSYPPYYPIWPAVWVLLPW